jgi:hypothetical protein
LREGKLRRGCRGQTQQARSRSQRLVAGASGNILAQRKGIDASMAEG